jgi:chorismate-pyruvate lyase
MSGPRPGGPAGARTREGELYPLDDLYARSGLRLPEVEFVPGSEVPDPYHELLVHNDDMTPTLESFYGSDIHLEVWHSEHRDGCYFREVVLHLDRNEWPVEFGANKIHLDLFAPEVRELILQERLPLGHILKVMRVAHTSRPRTYLRLIADEHMKRAFQLQGRITLYGRTNILRDPEGRPLSEIVEILPPFPEGYPGVEN